MSEQTVSMEEVNGTTDVPLPVVENYDLKTLTQVEDVFKAFQSSMNQFLKGIRDFTGSKRQLEDVLINLTISPLNKEDFEWSYPEQKTLFELGTLVNSTKFFLMLAGMEKENKIRFIDNEVSTQSNS